MEKSLWSLNQLSNSITIAKYKETLTKFSSKISESVKVIIGLYQINL